MNPAYPAVARRAEHRCEYCHAPEAVFNFPLEVEHILPPNQGGTDDLANLALACRACNLFKSDKQTAIDPVTGQQARLFNPREGDWLEHFRAMETGEIIGLTGVGRATVELLKLNAPHQRAARRMWWRLALFP
ncbi:MAG: HNH endonuclease [Pirellulaceae bacterium]